MNLTAFWPARAVADASPAYRISARLASLLLVATGLSDYLFWHELVGFNGLVYMVFLVVAQLLVLPRYAPVRRTAAFWVAVGGCLASGGLVAWYGSDAAELAALASGLMLVGVVNQPQLRLVSSAVGTAVAGILPAVALVLGSLRVPEGLGGRLRRGWYYGRLLGLPLLALVVFQVLFTYANPRYAALSMQLWDALGEGLARLLEAVSIPHLLFLLLCGVGAVGTLVAVPVHFFLDHESRFGEFVRRQRDGVASFAVRRPNFSYSDRGALALRKEWLAAVASIGLLNAMLLVVNVVDVRWLWFGFRAAPGFDLTQFVHEGTYVLILSILLAAGIMLWFFRRNLNFYKPGLPLLRWGATLWVLQNAVLAVSVGLRNYYYIEATELAYKRIGVYGFLLLTLFGLATVLLKIWQRRSAFSLVRLNSWAAYALLLGLAAGNWEIWIARYNLQPRFTRLNIGFLLTMPPRVLPVLAAREGLIDQAKELVEEGDDGYFHATTRQAAHKKLHARLAEFRAEYPERHWQSRTGASEQAYQQLTSHD
ncbi:hypothetical protein GCM10023172_06640 [Hymenobacter ginsengisoli]|uniref:DUF4173 domain-containing protein n=1 Tax=Hymenobacter ginsengisoli TaxID=1051626 RepID=A0ABP8Q134_9BACT|nr:MULTISPECIES: DUF4173 domain-containing protein [unclassified Hymenobacter]MBO2032686.1 DUF4173 domain-containing protein [Hymenobacter sp. BT559]